VPDYEKMKLLNHLPWSECDIAAGYPENAPFRKFISSANEPGKLLTNHRKYFTGIKVPAFISGGWFDGFREETIESFQLLKTAGANDKVRNFSRLVIGPWVHGGLGNPELFGRENGTDKENERKFTFLSNILAEPDKDPLPGDKQVRFFMLGENRWYDDDNWPPVNMHYEAMYLHGNGLISPELPQKDTPCRTYISDPAKPVDSFNVGILTENIDRSDVLVYTSDELTADMKIAGEIRVSFSASVSAMDTDFFVTLSDVHPDGRVMHCVTGMVRARFRDSLDKAELLEPGKVYNFEVIVGNCAVNFLAGHRIQVAVCGQSFPQFDRNAQSFRANPELWFVAI
jgi:putative CocE/NonD family hydrolase